MKLFLLLFFTVCAVISCSVDKNKQIERLLTNGNKKEWVLVKVRKDISEDERYWDSFVMGFKADHSYYYYYLVDEEVLYPNHPMVGRWSIEGDGILVQNKSSRVKIEYINEDILIINGSPRSILVYRSKGLYSPNQFKRPVTPLSKSDSIAFPHD
jgi:hypothetical protein